MSKASEWARVFEGLHYRAYQRDGEGVEDVAMVTREGHLYIARMGPTIKRGVELTCSEAIEFARWILDTFGEAP